MADAEPESIRLAKLEQRVHDLSGQVKLLIPLATLFAETRRDLVHFDESIDSIRRDLSDVKRSIVDRDEQVSAERRATRAALYGLIGVLATGILGSATAIGVAFL